MSPFIKKNDGQRGKTIHLKGSERLYLVNTVYPEEKTQVSKFNMISWREFLQIQMHIETPVLCPSEGRVRVVSPQLCHVKSF